MDKIIRSPSVAPETRRLRRSQSVGVQRPALPEHGISGVPAADRVPGENSPLNVLHDAAPAMRTGRPGAAEQQRLEAELAAVRGKLAEHEMELRRIQTAAEKQGYAAGLAQGAADAKKNAAEQAERLASIASALYRARTSVLDSAQDALVELATIAVCRILGEQAVSPAGVAGAVHQALRQCGLRGKLVLRLHPQDCTLLREIAGAQASLPATVDLQADAAVGLGGCIVENESGKLDARLDTQMARLAETLLAVRRRIGSGGEAI